LAHTRGMARPALRIEVSAKDQRELRKLVAGGVQQVRVLLRALALLQLAKDVAAPRIAGMIPLTPQATRNVGRRYQQGGLERALYEKTETWSSRGTRRQPETALDCNGMR
jgi:hypothetical protein